MDTRLTYKRIDHEHFAVFLHGIEIGKVRKGRGAEDSWAKWVAIGTHGTKVHSDSRKGAANQLRYGRTQ